MPCLDRHWKTMACGAPAMRTAIGLAGGALGTFCCAAGPCAAAEGGNDGFVERTIIQLHGGQAEVPSQLISRARQQGEMRWRDARMSRGRSAADTAAASGPAASAIAGLSKPRFRQPRQQP